MRRQRLAHSLEVASANRLRQLRERARRATQPRQKQVGTRCRAEVLVDHTLPDSAIAAAVEDDQPRNMVANPFENVRCPSNSPSLFVCSSTRQLRHVSPFVVRPFCLTRCRERQQLENGAVLRAPAQLLALETSHRFSGHRQTASVKQDLDDLPPRGLNRRPRLEPPIQLAHSGASVEFTHVVEFTPTAGRPGSEPGGNLVGRSTPTLLHSNEPRPRAVMAISIEHRHVLLEDRAVDHSSAPSGCPPGTASTSSTLRTPSTPVRRLHRSPAGRSHPSASGRRASTPRPRRRRARAARRRCRAR